MQRGARAQVIRETKRKRDLRLIDVLSTSRHVELFLGSYGHAYSPLSQEQILSVSVSVCHFEDKISRDRPLGV